MKRITISEYPQFLQRFRENNTIIRQKNAPCIRNSVIEGMEILVVTEWSARGKGMGNGEVYHLPRSSSLASSFFDRNCWWSSQFIGWTKEEAEKKRLGMLEKITLQENDVCLSFQLFPADIKFFLSPSFLPTLWTPPEFTAGELWEGLGWRKGNYLDITIDVERVLRKREQFSSILPLKSPSGMLHYVDFYP